MGRPAGGPIVNPVLSKNKSRDLTVETIIQVCCLESTTDFGTLFICSIPAAA